MKPVLKSLMVLLTLASFALILVPGILWYRSPDDFPWRDELTPVVTLMALEKLRSMFLHNCRRHSPAAAQDWTAVTVGVSYVAVWYIALLEFHARQGMGITWALVVVSVSCYVAAVLLRHRAFRHLGQRCAVNLHEATAEHGLVTSGPYRYARHPIYTGACLESLCLPAMLGAWWALLFAAIVYVPCQVQRAVMEEGVMRKLFGPQYDEYAARTWAFVPLWPKGSSRR